MWAMLWEARELMPILFLGGSLMSFQFGVFPLALRRADVGVVFVIFGFGEVLGAWQCGRWVHRLGPQRYRLLTMVATAASLVLVLPIAAEMASSPAPISLEQHPARFVLAALAAFAFGSSDSAIAVLAYTDLGRTFRGAATSARAGGARQLLYSLGFLYGFSVGPYVPPLVQLAFLGVLLVVSWAVRVRAGDAETAAVLAKSGANIA